MRTNLDIALTNALRIGIPGLQSNSEGIRMGDEFFKELPSGKYQKIVDNTVSDKLYTSDEVAQKLERFQESIWY